MKIIIAIVIALTFLVFLVFAASFIWRIFISPPVNNEIEIVAHETTKTKKIQINIKNGTKIDGLAAKLMDYLRKRDFDVLTIGNWDNNKQERSIVLDHLGNIAASKNVAYALGIPDSLVFSDIDSSISLNSTVLIGNDYKKLKPFK